MFLQPNSSCMGFVSRAKLVPRLLRPRGRCLDLQVLAVIIFSFGGPCGSLSSKAIALGVIVSCSDGVGSLQAVGRKRSTRVAAIGEVHRVGPVSGWAIFVHAGCMR